MSLNEIAAKRRTSNILRPWIVTTVLCVAYLAFIYLNHYGLNFDTQSPRVAGKPIELGLLTLHYSGQALEFIWPTSAGAAGYDGQYTYYIAADPLHASEHLDVPAYPHSRILHPLLAGLLALGQAPLIPWTMLAINLIALAAGTAALEQLVRAENTSRWYALVYGLFGGVFIAVRVNTSEPLAYGLVLLAILAERRGRVFWHVILFALAALAKETTLFFVVGYLIYYTLERRWRDAMRLVLIVGLPFAAWQLVLRAWFGAFGIGSGGALATPFEILPFNGIWRLLPYGLGIFALLGIPVLAAALVPTLWGLWRSGRDALRRRWHPYVFLLLANAAIMPFVPFSTYREPLGIARFMPGLVISLLLYAALRRQRRVLSYSTVWVIFGLLLIS